MKKISERFYTIICLICLLIGLFTSSCKTRTVYIPVENEKTEYIYKSFRDSVHLYDSIFLKEKGDTVLLTKYRYMYRDRIRTDTIYRTDSIQIPYKVEIAGEAQKVYPKWLIIMACIGAVAIGYIGFRIFKQ